MKMMKIVVLAAALGISTPPALCRPPEPTADTGGTRGGGSARAGDLRVVCGAGLLPLVSEGALTGTVELPSGRVRLTGKPVRFGYCGYPVVGTHPTLVKAKEHAIDSRATSFVTGPGGSTLSCANGRLPFALTGSAEGTLRTGKGIVELHGDRNDVAVCLAPSASN